MDLCATNVSHEIAVKKFYTNYECKIGPMSYSCNQTVNMPSFPINSIYFIKCYIHIKWESKCTIYIRLVHDSDLDKNRTAPKFEKIDIKSGTKDIFKSNDETLQMTQCTKDRFYWHICLCDHKIYTNAITIKCLIVQESVCVTKNAYQHGNLSVTRKDLSDPLKAMFTYRKFADVTINVGEKTFLAHKCILAINPVFAAMLEHEMMEKKESAINVKDIDANVFAELLKFLYLGEFNVEINTTYRHLLNVIIAADMYQIIELKDMLAEIVIKYIDLDNVIDFLIIGDKCNVPLIKKESINFIGSHCKEIQETAAFKELTNTHTALAMELLCSFMNGTMLTQRV